MFLEARTLLVGLDPITPQLDHQAAGRLHDHLRGYQNEYKNQKWGPVRIVHNWNLLLVEQALGAYLWHVQSPSHGYRLAADYCRHYDPRYGESLNGPSRTKIAEIVRFMFSVEALEDERT